MHVFLTQGPIHFPICNNIQSGSCVSRLIDCILSRNGKLIVFELSNNKFLLVHLRMSGSFSKKPSKYDRAEILLSGGVKLFYRDSRKFGKWIFTYNPSSILNKLWPDALSKDFSWKYFHELMNKKNRMIKQFLFVEMEEVSLTHSTLLPNLFRGYDLIGPLWHQLLWALITLISVP